MSNNVQIINIGAIHVADGTTVDFVPEVDVPAGSIVVVGKLVGIAKFGIVAGSRGSITVRGVFEGSSSEDPGPRPPWWPEDWPWPPPPDEPVVIEAPPPLPNIIWPRLPPDHPYHLPPGYHYPDNLPEGHPGHFYPGMPPYPVIAP